MLKMPLSYYSVEFARCVESGFLFLTNREFDKECLGLKSYCYRTLLGFIGRGPGALSRASDNFTGHFAEPPLLGIPANGSLGKVDAENPWCKRPGI